MCELKAIYRCCSKNCEKELCYNHSLTHLNQFSDHFIASNVQSIEENKREEVLSLLFEKEQELSKLETKITEICDEICINMHRKTEDIIRLIKEKKRKLNDEINSLASSGFISRSLLAQFDIAKNNINEAINNLQLDEILEFAASSKIPEAFSLDFDKILLTQMISSEATRSKAMITTYEGKDLKNNSVTVKKYENLDNQERQLFVAYLENLEHSGLRIRKSDYFVNIYGWSTNKLWYAIIYEPLKYNLLDYIRKCKMEGFQISLEKVNEIMRRISIALFDAQDLELSCKSLSPLNIIITESHDIKLLITYESDDFKLFLAPEARQSSSFDEEKAGVYSLGLILVMIVCLIDPTELSEIPSQKWILKHLKVVKLPSNFFKMI
jgi:hypothetical protein